MKSALIRVLSVLGLALLAAVALQSRAQTPGGAPAEVPAEVPARAPEQTPDQTPAPVPMPDAPGTAAPDSAAEISREAEDDRGFLTRFLEEKLSGAGRQVVIEGFRGALSSRATFDRLTIADDNGVWITLENGAMQWTRTALLARRVEIDELTAERVILPRLPGKAAGPTPPRPEASEFALPQLPVAVNIRQLAVGRLELGPDLLGQPAALTVAGAMDLADGAGHADLTIDRVDGPRGRFGLVTAFSNETRVLKLDLALDEARDGLFTNLVKMNGRPALRAEIKGEGPLSDFRADISMATDQQPRLAGEITLKAEARDGAPGTAFLARLDGDIASLTAPARQAFFAGQSRIRAEGWRGQDGRLLIPQLKIATGALDLSGSVTTTARGAPSSARLTLLLGQDAGAPQLPVALPFGQVPTSVRSGNLRLDYDATRGADWTLVGRVGDISRPDLAMSELRIDGRGRVVLTPDQALQEIRGWVAFGMDDLAPADPGLAEALGRTLNGGLNLAFSPGDALKLWGMNINGDAFGLTGEAAVSGLRSGLAISGDVAASYRDLARLSRLAGRSLGGSAQAGIRGRYVPLGDSFDLDASIEGQDIRLGQANADRMLAGRSRIVLGARRDARGFALRGLTVNAANLTVQAQGVVTSADSDVTATVAMPDLAAADPAYRGALDATLHMSGPRNARRLALTGEGRDLAMGRPEIDGTFRGQTRLALELLQTPQGFELRKLDLVNPQLDAKGSGRFSRSALEGRLALAMPDLAVLGRGYSGGVTLVASAAREPGGRRIEVTGRGTDLRLGQQEVDGALTGITELALSAREHEGQITIDRLDLTNGQMLATLKGQLGKAATDIAGRVQIRSLASLGRGWRGAIDAQGSLRDDGSGGRRLEVTGTGQDLSFGQTQLDGALAGQTRLALRGTERDGIFAIDTASIDNPRLALNAEGRLGKAATDLRATLRADDLRFLGRGFRGALDARAEARADAGGATAFSASGTARGLAIGNARADAILAGETRVDLAGARRADGVVTLSRLQAENGQFRVTGEGGTAEALSLDARLNDLALLVPGFPGPLELKGRVGHGGSAYQIDLSANAPGETTARITGTAAANMSAMDLRIEGRGNAAAANPFLRTRSIEGPVGFDIRVNGRPSLQAVSGRVTLSDGRLAEPRFGLAIEALDASAEIRDSRIMVDLAGKVESGGRITVTGPIALTGDRPMDLAVRLDDVRLRDPNLYELRARGNLRVSGPQAAGPLLSGRIDLSHTELRIPSTGLGGAKAIPDITHLSERPPQRQTRAKAGLLEFPSEASREAGMKAPPATPPKVAIRFDLTISGPDQVFVRGRGVDAELGGQIRLTGNARQPIPVGRFELIRGRVDLLGKRFDLTEGLIELQGSLVPVIRLVAQTEQDAITTRIIIDGEARDPEITFESSPQMPEEEVLSQLLFGRGLDSIGPLQAAQLASAIGTLSGSSGEGLVGRLRASTGLDDLDLATDDQGKVSVRAGKYLSDNLYTDVQLGDDGKTRLNLNLDLWKSTTARGSVASDGESTLGLFYERDY